MKKIVAVQFQNTPFKYYHFFTDLDDLKSGDWVVVETKFGYQVALVDRYVNEDEVPADVVINRWVIQKLDLSSFAERKARIEKLEELREQMKQRLNEIDEFQLFSLVSKEDKKMRSLLSEFISLEK